MFFDVRCFSPGTVFQNKRDDTGALAARCRVPDRTIVPSYYFPFEKRLPSTSAHFRPFSISTARLPTVRVSRDAI